MNYIHCTFTITGPKEDLESIKSRYAQELDEESFFYEPLDYNKVLAMPTIIKGSNKEERIQWVINNWGGHIPSEIEVVSRYDEHPISLVYHFISKECLVDPHEDWPQGIAKEISKQNPTCHVFVEYYNEHYRTKGSILLENGEIQQWAKDEDMLLNEDENTYSSITTEKGYEITFNGKKEIVAIKRPDGTAKVFDTPLPKDTLDNEINKQQGR